MAGLNKSTRYFSSKQEKQIAKNLGGKQQINSGATPFYKGDVVIGDLMLIEAKTTTTSKKSISIQKEWLEKNRKEAFRQHKRYSALAFNFGPNEKNHYIIDEGLFQYLITKIKEEQ